MADLLERKVGIVACSCEELAEGTVARLAALKVLSGLRPRDTVTICLPLFLAGGAGDRAFAKLHPTITVDGCDLRCAARGTEKYSSKPAASVVVNELLAECGLERPQGRRRLNAAGQKAVELTAERLAGLVDQALGKPAASVVVNEFVSECGLGKPEGRRGLNAAGQKAVEIAAERLAVLVDQALGKEPGLVSASAAGQHEAGGEQREATCSCGSGVPVTRVTIEGQTVELVALPLILIQYKEKGRGQDESAIQELFETVKIYNAVPAEKESAYREVVRREYAAFCAKERA